MTEHQLVSLILSDNGKTIIFVAIFTLFLKKFIPFLIRYFSQTAKDFLKGIEDIRKKQEVLEDRIDDIEKKLEDQIKSSSSRFEELKNDIKRVREHGNNNSKAALDLIIKEFDDLKKKINN